MLYEHFEFFDVRLKVPKNKFCSHFEAVTFLRPALIFLNSENNLKEKIFHQPWAGGGGSSHLSQSSFLLKVIQSEDSIL